MCNLFQTGTFQLHSGETSDFKIECDALTDEDWQTLARLISQRYTFGRVYGIPTGGWELANRLKQYASDSTLLLIVDDVFTTGESMEEARRVLSDRGTVQGVVVFARGKCPEWITPIFQFWG